MKIAEEKVEKDTQKYADELAEILKKNQALRKRKEKAENETRMVQEEISKVRDENAEIDEEMEPSPNSNDVDSAITEELNARKIENSAQE